MRSIGTDGLCEKCRERNSCFGYSDCDDARTIARLRRNIADLEACVRAMHAAVPGGMICDPQRVADDLREIARNVGITIDD